MMTKSNHTKSALISSVVALLICFTMLIGTTFAWFTDSVVSNGNIIQSGTLDIEMYWANGNEAIPTDASGWKDASQKAIFDYDLWEPGYTEAKHIKISNIGSLALKYQLSIIANGSVSELADVIDVYYFDNATQLTRENYATGKKLGTLSEVLNNENANALSKTISGSLLPESDKTVTLALHMQESAGNEYQTLSIGSDFSVQMLATQYTYEEDSFGNQYDEATLVTNAEELKSALADGKQIILPDGSVYEEPTDAIVVWDTEDLTDVLKKANNGKTVFLAAGEYALPKINDAKVDGFTLVGTALTKITGMVDKTSAYKNFVFENIEFTGNVKGTFSGNSTIKNCTFTQAGLAPSCNVNASATLTIENCTFNNVSRAENIHFGGKDGGTVVVKNCVFNNGYVAFGRAMNVTLEKCDFNGAAASCYGSYIFNNCTFDADAQVYIHTSTVATEVNLTMNGCSVDGGADVTSVCYNTGNNNGGVKTFTIDGKLYNHDELQAFPSN